jgi:putative membrane protein
MLLKLAGVVFLVIYHLLCGRYVRAINEDRNRHNHVFYRFFNEVPVLFLFAIVLLAVLKPF